MLSCASIYRKTLPALVLAGAAMVMYSQPVLAQAAGNVRCTGCVDARDIKKLAVKSGKIRGSAVTNDKIANGAVTGSKIADGQVGTADLANGAVTEAKLSSDVVNKLNVIGSGGGDITAVRTGPSSGLTGGVEEGDADLAVDFSAVAAAAHTHTGADIDDESLTGADVQNGSIMAVDLAPGVLPDPGVGSSGSVTIPYSAFQPLDDFNQVRHIIDPLNGRVRPVTGTTVCLAAPVHLPDGVTVNQLDMVIRDFTPANNFTFVLRRVDIDATSTGVVATMATITTNGSSVLIRTFSDTTIANATVDADGFAYTIDGCLTASGPPSAANLFAAIIRY